jgi:hypothetical protein
VLAERQKLQGDPWNVRWKPQGDFIVSDLPSPVPATDLDRDASAPRPRPQGGAPHRRGKESLPANIAQAIAWGAGAAVVAEWIDGADDAGSNRPDA